MEFLLHQLFSRLTGPAFTVTYWTGETRRYGQGDPAFALLFRTRAAARRLLRSPELGFGEGYTDGEIVLEGDLDALLAVAYLNESRLSPGPVGRWLHKLSFRLPRSAVLQGRHVRHHYDLGNDFFRLWLDPTLTYSCAYFRSPDDTLEQAQLQKIDHVLAKLHLQPSDRLLDIGCGWGQLVIRAAQQYGVRALGITLSHEQCAAGQERIAALGLQGKVEIRLLHYSDLTGEEPFDKIASVGMFEHVGRPQIPVFARAAARLLRPGGLFLLHTITRPRESPVSPWISRYIFPGGYVPAWREVIHAMADEDLWLLDAENLRPHYAMTLDRWSAAFAEHEAEVRAMYDERFVRMWRLYLRSSSAAFRYGGMHLHQFLLSRSLATDYPLTRAFLYNEGCAR